MILEKSAPAYTLQTENFSRGGGQIPVRNPRHFLTVKVLECGGEKRGLKSLTEERGGQQQPAATSEQSRRSG